MSDKPTRDHIIEAADLLFYQGGYDHTSFADIAAAVKISRGNFYYHFKTKDQILEEVIHLRMDKTQAMLDDWETETATPEVRIGCFIRLQITNREKIKAHGCPIGTLCGELAKLDHGMQCQVAALFTLFRDWLRVQFEELGAGDEADKLAMHLVARSQGVATLANAFHDDEFVEQEVSAMLGWLETTMKTLQEKNGCLS